MATSTINVHPTRAQSFAARASLPTTSPLASYLFRLMHVKKTNLCLSADVTSTARLLRLAEEVGNSICMIKTHADIIDDFGDRTIDRLTEIAHRRKFLIFEDRKFGDIGSTVQRQYTSGPLRIIEWASIVNAHIFPGPAMIHALSAAAADFIRSHDHWVRTEISADDAAARTEHEIPDDLEEKARRGSGGIISTTTIDMRIEPSPSKSPSRTATGTEEKQREDDDDAELTEGIPTEKGLLLLAEMSSEGNLLTGAYTEQCVSLARQHREFVLGFIAQRSLNAEPDDNFITLTPGVSLPPPGSGTAHTKGDGLGQQYNTPRHVVLDQGCDVIIVGRGILKADQPAKEAERYRQEAWKAYEERLKEV